MMTDEEQYKVFHGIDITERDIWEGNCKLSNGELQFFHFTYNIDDLLDEVTMETSYHGKFTAIVKESAQSIDRMSLTKDDKAYFLKLLKKASNDVFSHILAFAKLEKSFFFNQDVLSIDLANLPSTPITIPKYQIVEVTDGTDVTRMTCGVESTSDYPFETETTDATQPSRYWNVPEDYSESVHYILMIMPAVYKSMIDVIDEAIKNSLVSYVLYLWYKSTDPNKAIEEKQTYDEEVSKLRVKLDAGFGYKTTARLY